MVDPTLKVGDKAILDKKYRGGYEVKIVGFTLSRMYATVSHQGNKWDVMANRLTPIENQIKNENV